ncbi:hypothetical protein JTB14_008534 [Gonioctena quinquepunctata]|nr:hypothetical protein JTB14_008534 [Gonioctena quinquepunctata]
MVQQSYVPYVMRAKQMDMKKLKGAVWQYLTNTANTLIDKETQKRHGQVIQTTFSELYKGLPKLLLEKECKELSCSLAFVALLHLCNEQNLELTQIYTYKDFHIKGPY